MSTTEENERRELSRQIQKSDCGSPYLSGYLSGLVLSHAIPIREARFIAEAVKRAVEIKAGEK